MWFLVTTNSTWMLNKKRTKTFDCTKFDLKLKRAFVEKEICRTTLESQRCSQNAFYPKSVNLHRGRPKCNGLKKWKKILSKTFLNILHLYKNYFQRCKSFPVIFFHLVLNHFFAVSWWLTHWWTPALQHSLIVWIILADTHKMKM